MPCWFLPPLHQDYSIFGQLLSLLHFSFLSASFFLSLISVYYSSLFCLRKLKGFISLAAHTPAPLQMTSALPPVTAPALCSFIGAGLQHADEENTPARLYLCVLPTHSRNTPLHPKKTLIYMCDAPKTQGLGVAALPGFTKHFCMCLNSAVFKRAETLWYILLDRDFFKHGLMCFDNQNVLVLNLTWQKTDLSEPHPSRHQWFSAPGHPSGISTMGPWLVPAGVAAV